MLSALLLLAATDALYTVAIVHAASISVTKWLDLGWLAVNWMLVIAVLLPAEERVARLSWPRHVERAAGVVPYLFAAVLLGVALFVPRLDGGLVVPGGAFLVVGRVDRAEYVVLQR